MTIRFFSLLSNKAMPSYPGIQRKMRIKIFLWQRILRVNADVPWPVHPTSKVTNAENIIIGHRTYPGLTPCCYIQGYNGIIFGNNIRIGPGVGIISANHSIMNYDKHIKVNPIQIGDHCWIGMNAVILPGITIGEHVIIGAGSVVTKSFPSGCIIAGNPAKLLRRIDSVKDSFVWKHNHL